MAKKLTILGVIVVVIVAGIAVVRNTNLLSMSLAFLDGQKEEVIRGTLVIPVTATGMVESRQLIQIKSKASGVVSYIPVIEGQMVKEGDVLLKLDPVDENRNMEARQADLDRATSVWEKSKIALKKQKVDLPILAKMARARLKDAEAKLKDAEFRWNRVKKMGERSASTQELSTNESSLLVAEAARDMARLDLERAMNDEDVVLQSAEQDVVQAGAAAESAKKAWEDAQQRLEETTVRARSDGMVYKIQVRPGETIQSGTSSFAGGTPLMILADVKSMFVMAQIDEADIGAIRRIAPKYARPGQTQKFDEAEYIRKAMEIIAAAENDQEADAEGKIMVGRPVEITVDAYRTQEFRGVIEAILPEPERANNAIAFRVRIRLIGDDLQKLMGLQADLWFKTKELKDVVLVKNEALRSEGRDCFVYVPFRSNSRERWREKKVPVKIGETDGTFTEIISGLEAGADVWVKRPKLTDKEKREIEQAS